MASKFKELHNVRMPTMRLMGQRHVADGAFSGT